MTTQQIADKLYEFCQKGEFEKAQKELFSKDAVSIEPFGTPAFEKETKGLDAILEKGKKWGSMVEAFHGTSVSQPIVAGNAIAMAISLDATMKGREREKHSEIAIYQTKDGKVVSEEFFM